MSEISHEVERANARNFYAEIAWMSIAFAMEWFYLAVFAIRMGATPVHLAILTSGRALGLAIGSGLANRWGRRFDNPIKAILFPVFIYRSLLYLSVVVVPFLPGARIEVFLTMTVLSSLPNGIGQGIFVGMLPTALNKTTLARVVRLRSVLMNTIVLVCMGIIGQLLEHIPVPVNYQLGFLAAFLAGMIALLHLARIKVPNVVKSEVRMRSVNVWAHVPFRRFVLVVLVLDISVFMAAPLVQLQLVRALRASDGWISLFGIAEMAAGALFALFVGPLVARFGVRKLLIVTAAATGFHALILGVTLTLPPYVLGAILFGAGWFTVNILLYNRLVDIVPPDETATFGATYQFLINCALFVGPLVGTFLVEYVMSIPAALLVIAALRFLASFLLGVVRVEPQSAPMPVEATNPSNV